MQRRLVRVVQMYITAMSSLWSLCVLLTTQGPIWKQVGGESVQVFTRLPDVTDVYRGDSLDMLWMTSLPDDDILWCYWKYELGGAWDQFLGYHNPDKKRLDISPWNKGWTYNNRQSPCQGGIRRLKVTSQYSGNYVMVIGLMNGTEFESDMFPVSVGACQRLIGSNHTSITYSDRDHVTYSCIFENRTVSSSCNSTSGEWQGAPPVCAGPSENQHSEINSNNGLIVGLIFLFLIICGVVAVVVFIKMRHQRCILLCDMYSPVFSEPFPNKITTIASSDQETHTIQAEGNPTPQVKFFQNGVEWTGSAHITLSRIEAEHRLTCSVTLYHCTLEDTFELLVEASNALGKISRPLQLVTESPPICQSGLTDVHTFAGQDACFDAIFQGHPELNIQWFNNGTPMHHAENVTEINKYSFHATLKIQNVELQHSGTVSVKANNKYGTDEKLAHLSVTPVLSPKFIVDLENTWTKPGQEVSLSVTVHASPPPSITWKKDGRSITGSENIFVTSSPVADANYTTKESLIFLCTRESDSGEYQVFASSEHYMENTSKRVTLCVTDKTETPEFTIKPDNAYVMAGDALILTAEARGTPPPEILWRTPRHTQTRQTVVVDGQISKLIIGKAVPDDSSKKYHAVAQSAAGKSKLDFSVKVFETAIQPKIQKISNCTVCEGEPMVFETTVQGFPVPILQWLLNGTDMAECDGVDIEHNSSGDSVKTTLKIDKVRHVDQGTVELLATNDGGSSRASAQLTVNVKPVFLSVPDEVIVYPKGQTLVLNAEASGRPQPTIEWGLRVISKPTIKQHTKSKSSASINNFNSLDIGQFKVSATNEAGTAVHKFTLKLDKPETTAKPRIKNISDMKVKEMDEVVFLTTVDGIPTPSIEWSINGEIITDCERIVVEQQPHSTSIKTTLRIRDCHATDEGNVKVIARNDTGESTASAKLTVNVKPTLIQKPDEVIKYTQGKLLVLTAEASGRPQPRIKWHLNTLSRPTIKVDENGRISTAIIKNFNSYDTGHVKVSATNDAGTAVHMFTLELTEEDTDQNTSLVNSS